MKIDHDAEVALTIRQWDQASKKALEEVSSKMTTQQITQAQKETTELRSKKMDFFRSSIILIIALFLAGCAAPSKVMINPKTGHQIDCSTWGIGWLGAPVALAACK